MLEIDGCNLKFLYETELFEGASNSLNVADFMSQWFPSLSTTFQEYFICCFWVSLEKRGAHLTNDISFQWSYLFVFPFNLGVKLRPAVHFKRKSAFTEIELGEYFADVHCQFEIFNFYSYAIGIASDIP